MVMSSAAEDPKVEKEKRYAQLTEVILKTDAAPNEWTSKVFLSNEYQNWVAGVVGVEVASRYAIVSASDGEQTSSDTVVIEFLHEVLGSESPDIPMYRVKGPDPTTDLFNVEDDLDSVKKRDEQRAFVKSRRLSAHLCASRMAADTKQDVLIPFGEILAYTYLYRLVQYLESHGGKSTELDSQGFTDAWRLVASPYAKRNVDEADLIAAIEHWYVADAAGRTAGRSLMKADAIEPVYEINAALTTLLSAWKAVAPGTAVSESHFLCQWGRALVGSLESVVSTAGLEDRFWQRTLINPIVESALCSRGLYVTVIRSPFQDGGKPAEGLSKAYAICTLHDSARLMDTELRNRLNLVLRTISHDDLMRLDYQKLQGRSEGLHSAQRIHSEIFKLASGSRENIQAHLDIIKKGAQLCLSVSPSNAVLVGWRGVGCCLVQRGANSSAPKDYEDYSDIGAWSVKMAKGAAKSDNMRSDVLALPVAKKLVKRVRLQLQNDALELRDVLAFGERGEGIMVFLCSSEITHSTETHTTLASIGTAMNAGLSLPFGGATTVGLFHSLKRGFNDFGPLKWYYRNLSAGWLMGTVMELIRASIIGSALGFLSLIVLVVVVIVHHFMNEEADAATRLNIGVVTNGMEYVVMVFSIALAAMGVSILVKPNLKVGQPEWMKKFTQPGTLERTLVRLVVMVLTINIVGRFLTLGDSGDLSWNATKGLLLYACFYLLLVFGLILIDRLILDERPEKEGQAEE